MAADALPQHLVGADDGDLDLDLVTQLERLDDVGVGIARPGQHAQRVGRLRRDGAEQAERESGDAQQAGRGGAHPLRKRSLMLVFERVCASTRFTMTAQYRLYLPSALGRLPLTTTEPAGTRP